jgi:5,5'-dehydrodivanillate O-demethylase oxygenase subunit
MMSAQENRMFTEVGPGTPMGELLRCYWHPIAGLSELDDNPVKSVRLLGEDLVLFRDKSGTLGLVDRHCPHRRADLANGILEACGIRCSYHGWHFAPDGRCLEQPFEDIANPKGRFKDKIRLKAYQVKALAGMVFAYIGSRPAPELPMWEPFTWRNGFQQIVLADVPCNWLQCQENSCDPVHFEWMHRNWSRRLKDADAGYGPRHLELKFEEFDYGHIYKRVREDTDHDSDHWTVGSVSLFPNIFFLGDHIEWRVPVDDENTLSVTWALMPTPSHKHPFVQDSIPCWKGPVRDPVTGHWITSHVMNQDIVAWVGQGRIADRTKEHLGRSDMGIVMMRKAFRQSMEAVANGGDPKGIVRDPDVNRVIMLPVKHRDLYTVPRDVEGIRARASELAYNFLTPEYPFQAGMPETVRQAYREALGLDE